MGKQRQRSTAPGAVGFWRASVAAPEQRALITVGPFDSTGLTVWLLSCQACGGDIREGDIFAKRRGFNAHWCCVDKHRRGYFGGVSAGDKVYGKMPPGHFDTARVMLRYELSEELLVRACDANLLDVIVVKDGSKPGMGDPGFSVRTAKTIERDLQRLRAGATLARMIDEGES